MAYGFDSHRGHIYCQLVERFKTSDFGSDWGGKLLAGSNPALVTFQNWFIFINQKLVNMDKIIETDKLSIAYDKYCSSFTATMYDTYGHYIDEVVLSKEDIAILIKGLDEIREKILG